MFTPISLTMGDDILMTPAPSSIPAASNTTDPGTDASIVTLRSMQRAQPQDIWLLNAYVPASSTIV